MMTMVINGEPWFVGKDVAMMLGYVFPRRALYNHVDEEDKTTVLIQHPGSNYKSKTIFINESGLYSLILSSKLRNIDEVRYFNNIKDVKDKLKKVKEKRKIGMAGTIPVLVYGNGLFDYSLVTDNGEEELWNSENGYDVLVLGENCELAL